MSIMFKNVDECLKHFKWPGSRSSTMDIYDILLASPVGHYKMNRLPKFQMFPAISSLI